MESSSSVPSQYSIHSNFPQQQADHDEEEEEEVDDRPRKIMDGLKHNRSRSVDLNAAKFIPAGRRNGGKYRDPYGDDIPSTFLSGGNSSRKKKHGESSPYTGSNKSLSSVREEERGGSNLDSSRKSSLCSFDSDSSRGSRSDANSPARQRHRQSKGSRESHQRSSRGDGSSDKSKEGMSFGKKLSRAISDTIASGSPKMTPSPKASREKKQHHAQKTSGSSRASSDSGGDNSKSRVHQNTNSSSDGTSRRKMHSPVAFYRDDDPTYIFSNLNLYLDMEVFDNSIGEVFKMVFRSPVVKYGEVGEVSMLTIVSNINAYLFRIIAPEW